MLQLPSLTVRSTPTVSVALYILPAVTLGSLRRRSSGKGGQCSLLLLSIENAMHQIGLMLGTLQMGSVGRDGVPLFLCTAGGPLTCIQTVMRVQGPGKTCMTPGVVVHNPHLNLNHIKQSVSVSDSLLNIAAQSTNFGVYSILIAGGGDK